MFTGKKCNAWAGHKAGKYYTCQGNILAGEEVVTKMAEAFEEAKGPLAWRLMAALEAGDQAGGDKRGKQSAAILMRASAAAPTASATGTSICASMTTRTRCPSWPASWPCAVRRPAAQKDEG